MLTIEVRNRVVGAAPAEQLPPIALDLLNEQMTAAELIATTVEEQVRDLLINRKLDAEQARLFLNRQYLTESEARQQAEKGAIRFPSKKTMIDLKIDIEAEIYKAHEAFEKGTFVIYVDGQQAEHLDEMLTFGATSKVTFLRLTPLVGG